MLEQPVLCNLNISLSEVLPQRLLQRCPHAVNGFSGDPAHEDIVSIVVVGVVQNMGGRKAPSSFVGAFPV